MKRQKRLHNDYQTMKEMLSNSEFIKITSIVGDPPETYKITFYCTGLAKDGKNSEPYKVQRHELEIYLHREYPTKPPLLSWQTKIFHPNILSYDRNGGVCIGTWTPATSLASLCVQIGEMVQYKIYNIKDPLDLEAVEWVKKNMHRLPIDNRDIIGG